MKVVVRTRPPVAVPVIVIVDVPVVAVELAVNVSVELQVGLHEAGEKAPVTPAGRPEAVKLTDWVAPETSVAVTVAVKVLPSTPVPLVGDTARL